MKIVNSSGKCSKVEKPRYLGGVAFEEFVTIGSSWESYVTFSERSDDIDGASQSVCEMGALSIAAKSDLHELSAAYMAIFEVLF